MLPIGSIFRRFGVSYHCYADDTQLYIPFKRNDKSATKQLMDCYQELKAWLNNNLLHLNDDKTQIVLFGPTEKSDLSNVDLGSLTSYRSFAAKNMGFTSDSGLKLKQINTVVSSSFYHLRRLAKVKSFLSRNSFEIVIHAFISSRLDYCNSLYRFLYSSASTGPECSCPFAYRHSQTGSHHAYTTFTALATCSVSYRI